MADGSVELVWHRKREQKICMIGYMIVRLIRQELGRKLLTGRDEVIGLTVS